MNDAPRTPSRRDFLATATVAAAVVFVPLLQLPHARGEESTWIATVKPETLKDGDLTERFAAAHHFILARRGDEIFALDVACTHKRCPVHVSKEHTELVCRCHGSQFASDGEVLKGPAHKALYRHAVRLNADGVVEVDAAHRLDADDVNGVLKLPSPAK